MQTSSFLQKRFRVSTKKNTSAILIRSQWKTNLNGARTTVPNDSLGSVRPSRLGECAEIRFGKWGVSEEIHMPLPLADESTCHVLKKPFVFLFGDVVFLENDVKTSHKVLCVPQKAVTSNDSGSGHQGRVPSFLHNVPQCVSFDGKTVEFCPRFVFSFLQPLQFLLDHPEPRDPNP